MNKKTLTILAALVAGSTFATEYHWKGNGPDTTSSDREFAWNNPANWTDASGNSVQDYPRVAGDSAVFHGMKQGQYVCIADTDTIVIDQLRFAEGHSTIGSQLDANVTITRLVVNDSATFAFAPNDTSNHWDPGYPSPNNFKILNRTEACLGGGDGAVRGSICYRGYKSQDDFFGGRRGYITLDTDGKVVVHNNSEQANVNLGGNNTYSTIYSFAFGGWGGYDKYRGLTFSGNVPGIVATFASGMLVPLSDGGSLGVPADPYQGTVSTGTENLYYWSRFTATKQNTNGVSAVISAPVFYNAGNGICVFNGDHSGDSCQIYYVSAGTLALGGNVMQGGDGNSAFVDVGCTMGTGTIDVGWDATLDVFSANSLNVNSTINVRSYNGKKADFGTIKLTNGGTVNKLQIDGVDLDAGTYGATGSGAANIRDDIFTGTGILTVTNGTYVPPDDPPVTETKPLVIYFN